MKEPSTLSEMAVRAMQEAVAKVVEEHRRQGRPLAVWRDGRAVWLPVANPAAAVNEPPHPNPGTGSH